MSGMMRWVLDLAPPKNSSPPSSSSPQSALAETLVNDNKLGVEKRAPGMASRPWCSIDEEIEGMMRWVLELAPPKNSSPNILFIASSLRAPWPRRLSMTTRSA
jgi:hypothetical protein